MLMKSIDCWINIDTPVLVLFTPVFWNGLSVVVWSSITLVVELMTILLAFKGSASRDRWNWNLGKSERVDDSVNNAS